mgnify:CR=1 FL=1
MWYLYASSDRRQDKTWKPDFDCFRVLHHCQILHFQKFIHGIETKTSVNGQADSQKNFILRVKIGYK